MGNTSVSFYCTPFHPKFDLARPISFLLMRYTHSIIPDSSPFSPHTSRSGPCALCVTSEVEVARAARAARSTQRPERSEWPATYSYYYTPHHACTTNRYLRIVLSPHPPTHLLHPYLHRCTCASARTSHMFAAHLPHMFRLDAFTGFRLDMFTGA